MLPIGNNDRKHYWKFNGEDTGNPIDKNTYRTSGPTNTGGRRKLTMIYWKPGFSRNIMATNR
jgi:hypothetical protein